MKSDGKAPVAGADWEITITGQRPPSKITGQESQDGKPKMEIGRGEKFGLFDLETLSISE